MAINGGNRRLAALQSRWVGINHKRDDDNNHKVVKKIENFDNSKIKKWFKYKGNLNYFGECDQNNVPCGIGRIIAQDGSCFIDGYFKNG